MDWFVSVAFEVPRDALPGLVLEVAQGEDPWWDNRRDELAHVDLGIARADVRRFVATKDIIGRFDAGPAPRDTEPTGQLEP